MILPVVTNPACSAQLPTLRSARCASWDTTWSQIKPTACPALATARTATLQTPPNASTAGAIPSSAATTSAPNASSPAPPASTASPPPVHRVLRDMSSSPPTTPAPWPQMSPTQWPIAQIKKPQV